MARLGPVVKLVGVQLWSDGWQDDVQKQFSQAFNDYWTDWLSEIVSEGQCFLGTGMMMDVSQRVSKHGVLRVTR